MKQCLECRNEIIGRSDKKFCCDDCRVSYHNRNYKDKYSCISYVNKVLRANYKILETLYTDESKDIHPYIVLSNMGYNFNFFTSKSNEYNKARIYCYDFSFTIEGNKIRIRRELKFISSHAF